MKRKTDIVHVLVAIIAILAIAALLLIMFTVKNAKDAAKLSESYIESGISEKETDTPSAYESLVSITELEADISVEYSFDEEGEIETNDAFQLETFPVSVDWEAMDNAYPEVKGWVYFPVLKISAPLIVSDTCTESDVFVAHTESESDFLEENNVLYFNNGALDLFAKKEYVSNESAAFVALKNGYNFTLYPWGGTSKMTVSGMKLTENTWPSLTEKGEWINTVMKSSDFENVYWMPHEEETCVTLVSLEDGIPAYSLVCSLSMF